MTLTHNFSGSQTVLSFKYCLKVRTQSLKVVHETRSTVSEITPEVQQMSLSEASLLSNDYGFQEKITRKAIFVTV
jgi:hypothetical protein